MNIRKFRKLVQEREALRQRRANVKTRELQSLARSLGRKRQGGRGKEQMWVSGEFPETRPLSIPVHSKDPIPWIVISILDQLEEEDFSLWAGRLGLLGDNQHG